jgi:hypothetical protein
MMMNLKKGYLYLLLQMISTATLLSIIVEL